MSTVELNIQSSERCVKREQSLLPGQTEIKHLTFDLCVTVCVHCFYKYSDYKNAGLFPELRGGVNECDWSTKGCRQLRWSCCSDGEDGCCVEQLVQDDNGGRSDVLKGRVPL